MNGRQFMKRGHSGTRIRVLYYYRRVLGLGLGLGFRGSEPIRFDSVGGSKGFERVCAKVSLLLVTCLFFSSSFSNFEVRSRFLSVI